MARARTRNPRGSGERLRQELLAAADEILDRTGDPAKVTVRGVATAVGVAPNAVYLHFADRDTLLAELAIRRLTECTAAIRDATEGVSDPLEALYVGHETYCRLALERPGHYRLLFHGLVHPADRDAAARLETAGRNYFQTCVAGCQHLIDAGVIRARDDGDARELAAALWTLEHGWCEIMLAGHGGDILPSPRDTLAALLEARG